MDIAKAIRLLDNLENNIEIMKKNSAEPIPYENLGEHLDILKTDIQSVKKCLQVKPDVYCDSNKRNSKYQEEIPLIIETYLKNKKNFPSAFKEIKEQYLSEISDKQMRNILIVAGVYEERKSKKKEG